MTADRQGIVDVLLPYALAGPLSYRVPDGWAAAPGSYVEAPLGSRQVIGVVWRYGASPPPGITLKPLTAVLAMTPMGELHRKFVDWVANYYVEPPGNVLRMTLRVPGAFLAAREQLAYRATGLRPGRITAQRARVLEALAPGPPLRSAEVSERAAVAPSVIRAMFAAGMLEQVPLPPFAPYPMPDPGAGRLGLSDEQWEAAKALHLQEGVTLLDGVTGSGKTEVYFEAMAAAVADGRQVLLLLPEIALTQQFLARVERRFGGPPAHWHSDVRPRERERVWRAVASGEARIVVGARSALFLPWARLGLIVVDEEHEGAYKQEDGVPYHARDMAIVYGRLGRFPVVLSSATPSLESLVNARKGRYAYVPLKDRYGRKEMPAVDLIDMRLSKLSPGTWISDRLFGGVTETLNSGDQALLFLNRRGYAPVTVCRHCGHRIQCPNCAAALIEHRFRRQLLCHLCGHTAPIAQACPACHAEGELVPCGPGIERLAEEARARFPEARLAILSSDLSRGTTLRDTLNGIAEGEFNLVIGTQLVAKGHNFPHLTLVGVVDADLALETGDPRGGERTWAILAQVAGRAGRGAKPGRALVQTYLPQHPLMTALVAGDRDGYLAQEALIRESAALPPYGRLAALIVSGADTRETERLARSLRPLAPEAENIRVLGPAPAPIPLIRSRFRWRYLVKAAHGIDIQAYLRQWLKDLNPKGSLRVDIDVDPYNFL